MFQHFAIFKFFQSRKYQHNEDDFQFKFLISNKLLNSLNMNINIMNMKTNRSYY